MKRNGLAIILPALLTSCSASEQSCGEAFCLTEKPAAISKQSPSKDFNLYRVEYGPSHYLIYEGNHPNTEHDRDLGPVGSNEVPNGFVSGTMRGGSEGYQIILRTQNRVWPNYVAVSMATKDPHDLHKLLAKLRGEQSSRG